MATRSPASRACSFSRALSCSCAAFFFAAAASLSRFSNSSCSLVFRDGCPRVILEYNPAAFVPGIVPEIPPAPSKSLFQAPKPSFAVLPCSPSIAASGSHSSAVPAAPKREPFTCCRGVRTCSRYRGEHVNSSRYIGKHVNYSRSPAPKREVACAPWASAEASAGSVS